MNTRIFVKFDEDEQRYVFGELPTEDEQLFRNCIEISRHFQEITQLYEMMVFDLDLIFQHYDLQFDDRVFPLCGRENKILHINALIGNAVSAARSLVESMDVFDREYIDSAGRFKTNYISRMYDECFSYRFVDFMRNYLQHGHVPISFDGEKIFFQLSEILDVSHMKINANLKGLMKNIEQELFEHGDMNARLTVVPILYEYFLLIYTLVHEFFKYAKWTFIDQFHKVQEVLVKHPEYISETNGYAFVGVYRDEIGMVHGFLAEGDIEYDIDEWIDLANHRLEQYERKNGHLFFLQIHYCLENRMPVMCMVDDAMLSENLEAFCLKKGSEISHLSFETYYGKMSMNTVYRLFPYIQYEDGVHWNVPYQEVSIADFVRTFPQVKKEGLKVFANNVAGADELFQRMMQDWSTYLWNARVILSNIGIDSPIDALDWISRIMFVWQGMQWFARSFSKSKKRKPLIRDICRYIRKRNEWNIVELKKNLRADVELLTLVLKEQGYVCLNGTVYQYDPEMVEKLEKERNVLMKKKYDAHGTHVNCISMNEAVEQLNGDLLYFSVLQKEHGKLEEFDGKVKSLLLPLKECEQYVMWDDLCKCVKIVEELPCDFCEADESFVCHRINVADEAVCAEIMKWEE